MNCVKKYKVDVANAHSLNMAGFSLPEISKKLGIPRTTLNRYLINSGFTVRKSYRDINMKRWEKNRTDTSVFHTSDCWKNALIRKFGHRCLIPGCTYTTIVEAHHIVFSAHGGKMTIANGILLCPNHHAEVHAGILDINEAFIKSGELLEKQETVNQQPSLINSPFMRILKYEEGSETNSQAKAVMETRAPETNKHFRKRKIITDRLREIYGQDIVQPVDIIN